MVMATILILNLLVHLLGKGADVVILQMADVAVHDLLGGILAAAHAVQLGHVLDGRDQHVHVVGHDRRHHLARLRRPSRAWRGS